MKENLDKIIFKSIFNSEGERFREKIRDEAYKEGIKPSSIAGIYRMIAKGELGGFTVPAFNIRTLTYDLARAIFRAAKRASAGLFIFELARLEMEYTAQSFDEYVTCVLSAALREGYHFPVFIQADHVQFNRERFNASPEGEISAIKSLIQSAIKAGVYNIDIDASTLVDVEEEGEEKQQVRNYKNTADLVKYIREIQPGEVEINIGGEIGEIGKRNSTPGDLRAFMDGLSKELNGIAGISKISIQTGTTHGGVVLPDGKIAEAKIDFETIKELSHIARNEYSLAGVVQHGASTLPEEVFGRFPDSGCVEIHLATGIQNFFFDSPALPPSLKEEIKDYLRKRFSTDYKKYETEDQFFYKTRKFALGEFKKRIWELPEDMRKEIASVVESWAWRVFFYLRVNETLRVLKPT